MPSTTANLPVFGLLPIRRGPRARSVPRWPLRLSDRRYEPASARAAPVPRSPPRLAGFAVLRSRPRRACWRRFADRLPACLRDVLRAPWRARTRLRCLQHVDRFNLSRRLASTSRTPRTSTGAAHAPADDDGPGEVTTNYPGSVRSGRGSVRDRLSMLRHVRGSSSRRRRPFEIASDRSRAFP